jgi:glycogen operon protein
VGRFPPGWREWNGKYRDTMRDFWRSHPVGMREFATRFCGSADMYGRGLRRPTASVNLITVHDGFTLRDLVSYDNKHNEANGEANRDGTSDNRSCCCRSASRCCSAATRWAGPSRATTTPTARTTR